MPFLPPWAVVATTGKIVVGRTGYVCCTYGAHTSLVRPTRVTRAGDGKKSRAGDDFPGVRLSGGGGELAQYVESGAVGGEDGERPLAFVGILG